MADSLVTAALTGVLVFVAGQYLLKLVLEPAVELRSTIAEIGNVISVHHDVLIVPTRYEEYDKKNVRNRLETLSGKLLGASMCILGYEYIRRIVRLPSRNNIIEAADRLNSIVGISRSGAAWTLEKNWRLTIETFHLLEIPLPSGPCGKSGTRCCFALF